jgi:HEAT repeat protein
MIRPVRLCMVFARVAGLFALAILLSEPRMRAQTPVSASGTVANPDAAIVEAPEKPKSKAELSTAAWKLLTDAVTDDKHNEIQIQGLSALGTMGRDRRSSKMMVEALRDSDVDVRTAAVLAIGQTRNRLLLPQIQKMLDDKEPQVAYTAAVTLWRMGDHSGEDLLMAVIDGDRKASAGLVNGSMHAASRELHDPTALAKMGALQGASMLLGPFGFGITAYEYIHKSGGGDSARVTAIELIAETKSPDVRDELMGALKDKDQAVRAAAAKALRGYHEPKVNQAIALLFGDTKRPVQLVAAASYLISSGIVMMPPPSPPIMGR